MKIYDEFGNVINILPTYQQGGFILPQYKPSQVTLQAPSSEGLFRATESGTNNDWNRFEVFATCFFYEQRAILWMDR